MKYYFSDTNKYLSVKLILSILILITIISCKKTNNDILNPAPNIPPAVIDSNKLISQISEELILNLNDAFRLKFVTNRVRGEFSVINPSAWEGSFTINYNVKKTDLIFPSYYRINEDSIYMPSIVSFLDHHSRYEYRVKNNIDTNRLEYIWVERDLNNHPIDTMIHRMYQNTPYNWEKEFGIYLNSNIKVPINILPLSKKWGNLKKLRGYDMIERWVTAGANTPENAKYTYKNFNTCFYQNLSDSLSFSFSNENNQDFLHLMKGFWLIEYPNFKRQVAFKINHTVYNGSKYFQRVDSSIVVDTSPNYVSTYNFGALTSEAGITRYNIYDQNMKLEKYLIVDRNEWNGSKSQVEKIKYVDLIQKIDFTISRNIL
jgi:hypothetical protein